AQTKFYLCTYSIGENDYVQLYYDTADGKFKLLSTDGGEDGTAIATAARTWKRGQLIKVAVRYSNGTLRLSVFDGENGDDGSIGEHVATSVTRTGEDLHGSDRIILTGNASGDDNLPSVWYDGYLYDYCLSDEALDTIANEANWRATEESASKS